MQAKRQALIDEASHAFARIAPFGRKLDVIFCNSVSKHRIVPFFGLWPITQHPADYINSKLGDGSYQVMFDGLARLLFERVVDEDEQEIRSEEIQKSFSKLPKGTEAPIFGVIKNEKTFLLCLSFDLKPLLELMVEHQQESGFLKRKQVRNGYERIAWKEVIQIRQNAARNSFYAQIFRNDSPAFRTFRNSMAQALYVWHKRGTTKKPQDLEKRVLSMLSFIQKNYLFQMTGDEEIWFKNRIILCIKSSPREAQQKEEAK